MAGYSGISRISMPNTGARLGPQPQRCLADVPVENRSMKSHQNRPAFSFAVNASAKSLLSIVLSTACIFTFGIDLPAQAAPNATPRFRRRRQKAETRSSPERPPRHRAFRRRSYPSRAESPRLWPASRRRRACPPNGPREMDRSAAQPEFHRRQSRRVSARCIPDIENVLETASRRLPATETGRKETADSGGSDAWRCRRSSRRTRHARESRASPAGKCAVAIKRKRHRDFGRRGRTQCPCR